MKLSVKSCSAAMLLLWGLAGCASNDEEVLVLPEIDNKVAPETVWSSSVGDGVEHFDSHLKPAIVGDKLFVASRKGVLTAFNLADGTELWTVDIRDGAQAPTFGAISHWWNERNAKVAGGVGVGYDKIYIGTEDGDVIAFNPETGERVWSVQVGGEVLTAPVAGEGYVLVNTGGGRLYALQPDTGEQRWMHESENSLLTLRGISEVTTAAGGIIYGTGSGKVGVLIADTVCAEDRAFLLAVQQDLFDLGSELAVPGHVYLSVDACTALESFVAAQNTYLPPLREFILPGGSRPAALAQVCRTVTRRAERLLVAVKRADGDLSAASLQYLNRLSDVFFVLARRINQHMGVADPLWRGVKK